MRRPRPARLIPAVVLAALWLCGPILALVHGLERQHTYCAEHGSFEEIAAGPAAAHSADAAAQPGAPDGEGHDECAFSPFALGASAPHAPASLAVQAPALPAPVLPALALPPAPPLAVLDVAPKASPPVSA